MSALDQALEASLQDVSLQDDYYHLILESDFYLPLESDAGEPADEDAESVRPLLVESEGAHYILLFDSEDRLNDWAKEPTRYAVISGALATQISSPTLHWAVNLGSQFAKQFVPEEIAYLKTLAS